MICGTVYIVGEFSELTLFKRLANFNRSAANRLLIVITNLDGFSVNHGLFAKLPCYTVLYLQRWF